MHNFFKVNTLFSPKGLNKLISSFHEDKDSNSSYSSPTQLSICIDRISDKLGFNFLKGLITHLPVHSIAGGLPYHEQPSLLLLAIRFSPCVTSGFRPNCPAESSVDQLL